MYLISRTKYGSFLLVFMNKIIRKLQVNFYIMAKEKFLMLTYNGTQINLYTDEKFDYVNLTDMATAWKGRKSILSWIRNNQTVEFLAVWEKKYNPSFDGAQMSTVHKLIKERNLSIKQWTDLFHEKQNLGEFSDFEEQLGQMKIVKNAREVLAIREEQRKKLLR